MYEPEAFVTKLPPCSQTISDNNDCNGRWSFLSSIRWKQNIKSIKEATLTLQLKLYDKRKVNLCTISAI